MNRTIAHIFAASLFTLSLASCNAEMSLYPDYNEVPSADGYTVIISGTASDRHTAEPLENVKVTLHAAEITGDDHGTIYTKSVYTDNRGKYEIREDGFRKMIICRLTAEDQTGLYQNASAEMNVTWSGPSFDAVNGAFYANDIDFYLEKTE